MERGRARARPAATRTAQKVDDRRSEPIQEAFGDAIRAAARKLWTQYPSADIEFVVHCLEYDLGMRPAVIRTALADEAAVATRAHVMRDSGGGE